MPGKMYVLLYPSTLIETLMSFEEMVLVPIVRGFAGHHGDKGRFDRIKGIFSSEDAARQAAIDEHKARGKDAYWAEDYIVDVVETDTFIMHAPGKPISTIDNYDKR